MTKEINTDSAKKAGVAAVIGLPNAGKSTLINALVGAKVSIVSHKVQTTRFRVCGIVVHDQAQIVLVDTPGIFKPNKRYERAMVGAAWDALPQADLVLHIVDVNDKGALDRNRIILDKLDGSKVALVLNKVDKIKKEKLLEIAGAFNQSFDYAATFMVSATQEKGLEALLDFTAADMPTGEWLYPEDDISDLPMRILAAEITREHIYHKLHKEVPYALSVQTETWENFDNGSVKIDQVITVMRDTQKAIVLGKGGQQIKEIGEKSRMALKDILDTDVHLKLFVRVEPNWQEKAEHYEAFGLDFGAGQRMQDQ